jgi:hypothetical protein
VAARAVTTKHAECRLPYVSSSTSEAETTVCGGVGEAPEASLVMLVVFITHIVRTRGADTHLFSSLAHACNLVKADSTVDVRISELLLCWGAR